MDKLAYRATTPRQQPAPRKARPCFSCGRTLPGDTGRFCSDRCRQWFDAGNRPCIETDPTYTLPPGQSGFQIACAGCGKTFASRGLRCCSVECARYYREQQDNHAILTEVGLQPAAKRQCAECGRTIPTWRKGRRVRKGTQFCSEACAKAAQRRARFVADNGAQLGVCPPDGSVADNAQKVPILRTLESAPEVSSPAITLPSGVAK
jgi:predicted nucleic acid-binding Zn ribbon protein